jgi:hypothetical protein
MDISCVAGHEAAGGPARLAAPRSGHNHPGALFTAGGWSRHTTLRSNRSWPQQMAQGSQYVAA